MAELEARYEKDESRFWRRALPDGVEVTLGRVAGASEWAAEWDGHISMVHAVLCWRNGALHIRRCTKPKPPRNPIYFKGVEVQECIVAPGECFVIGGTTFTVVDPPPQAPDETPANPALTELTCSRRELREVRFIDADRRIEALAALPEIIRYSPSASELEQRVVRVLLDGIPTAHAAAVVASAAGAATGPRVGVCCAESRRGESTNLIPSRRLVHEALHRRRQGVLHVWNRQHTPGEDSGFSLLDPRMNWAICTPVTDGAEALGLYIVGGVERNLGSYDSVAGDLQLKCDLKFAELTADIFGALRRVRDLQHRTSVLSTFLSPQVLMAVAERNIEEVLERRPVEATVLFCDLRGSCRIAEAGQGDLMGLWDTVSEALGVMTESITHEGGVIGDFQGDAAMAFWGWPLAPEDQAERAARAALAIRRRFAKAAQQKTNRLAGFACGLGLAHGPAVAGRIGTPDQFKVGVFGPVVNRAARLESLTKRFRVSILIDEAAAERLKGAGDQLRLRRLARLQPYGMSETSVVSELLPPAAMEPGGLSESQRLSYEAAFDSFLEGRWKDTQHHLKYLGNDGASDLLLSFIKANPNGPPPEWADAALKGVICMESK
jgi:adenylate cyclase